MQDYTKEELKDLLQILTPLYLSAFTGTMEQFSKPIKKMYAKLKAELKDKTSEYEYEEAMKEVLEFARKLADVDADSFTQDINEVLPELQKIAKKV